MPHLSLPADGELVACLWEFLAVGEAESVELVARCPNPHAGRMASESLACRLPGGNELRLFAKYGVPPAPDLCGRQGGVAYEADTYGFLIQPPVRFHGARIDPRTGAEWLFLDYLDGAVQVSRAPDQAVGMALAARWIGEFHAAHAAGMRPQPPAGFARYDAGYYATWARRAVAFDAGRHPWLPAAAQGYERMAELLVGRPTVIHGDYYADNVLYRNEAVYPVDWGWAAVAAGEIDLAALTERWPADYAGRCEAEYCQARWPGGPPTDFADTLAAARLYLCFRWLGHDPAWTADPKRRWRFDLLRDLSERLGLIHTTPPPVWPGR
jgi:hypothetical protein